MKQIIQDLKSGETILEEVPAPEPGRGQVLIRASYSLVSLGTERMLVEFGRAGWLEKARQQPEKVKQVLDKVKSDGLKPTLEAVFNKLGQPLPLGYCHVGKVEALGEGVTEFQIGDRVVSNGPHAEFVAIPKNLVARIPDGVSDEEASFTVIGSIGLQGIRLLKPELGETIVVIGLGLIGLLTAELLLASGCRVVGFDLDPSKRAIAQQKGILVPDGDSVQAVLQATQGIGADGVIITASAKTDEIISQAALMSRKRGRIILVGVIGLQLNRSEFYEKELTFQVSCSYGPGRYDDAYEQKGQDYPIAFVRWTEKRNFEAILSAITEGRLKVKELISEVVELNNYLQIYGSMSGSGKIASLLRYPEGAAHNTIINIATSNKTNVKGQWAIIGAGNFTQMTMLPALKEIGAPMAAIVSKGGLTAQSLAKKYRIAQAGSAYGGLLQDSQIGTVLITTRHNQHAPMVVEALKAGKTVFVEKPLALTKQELEEVQTAFDQSKSGLMVGFNRRFSPYVQKMKQALGDNPGPMNIILTMNAGFIPPNHWVHDPAVGGGRIIGEACHFIDLALFLSHSKVMEVNMQAMGTSIDQRSDNAIISLKMENGSQAVIHYFANGHKAYSKERIEVYSQNRVLILDNYRKLSAYGFKSISDMKGSQDKGHKAQFAALLSYSQGKAPLPIPAEDLFHGAKVTLAAIDSMLSGSRISLSC